MAMTPQLQALKAQYIKSVNAIQDENIRNLRLPYGEDFEVVHKFYRLRGIWRVSLFIMRDKVTGIGAYHCGDFEKREDALRETYRLNGWGEPKPRF